MTILMSRRTVFAVVMAVMFCVTVISPSAFGGEKVRFAHLYETDSAYHTWAVWSAKEIEKRTDGRYVVEVFPASQLGDDKANNEALSLGAVDIVYTGAMFAGSAYGPIAISSAPYMMRDVNHLFKYYKSDLFRELCAGYTKVTGHHLLPPFYFGTRLVTSNKPIRGLADSRNMKLRVPSAPLFQMLADVMQAKATPIAFSEVYLALQQGVVDGQENPLVTIKAKKFYEVQKYINMTDHIIDTVFPIISKKRWTSLSEQDKKIFEQVFQESGDKIDQDIIKQENELLTWFTSQGVIVNREVNRSEFQKAAVRIHSGPLATWSKDDYDRLQSIK